MYKEITKNIILLFLGTILIGCSHIKNLNPFDHQTQNGTQTYSNNFQKSTSYDFPDIPIPPELKLDQKKSLVFESPKLKVGILVYRGRVEALSLFEYFEKKLPEYGWRLRSYFKYGKYIVLFSKNKKDLVIRIQDRRFTTEVFIWVIPTTQEKETPNPDIIQEEEIKP